MALGLNPGIAPRRRGQGVLLLLASVVFVSLWPSLVQADKPSHVPAGGFVPTAETAVRIAEAVWLPIYGEAVLRAKPFHARLVNDVWIVEGSLPGDTLGGVPEIEIAKADGRILRVGHGQ